MEYFDWFEIPVKNSLICIALNLNMTREFKFEFKTECTVLSSYPSFHYCSNKISNHLG